MSDQQASLPTIADTFEILRKMTVHIEAMQDALDLVATRSIAHQATLHAVIDTHPNPKALFESFTSCMDSIGAVSSVADNTRLRSELQQMQTLILRTINSASLRTRLSGTGSD